MYIYIYMYGMHISWSMVISRDFEFPVHRRQWKWPRKLFAVFGNLVSWCDLGTYWNPWVGDVTGNFGGGIGLVGCYVFFLLRIFILIYDLHSLFLFARILDIKHVVLKVSWSSWWCGRKVWLVLEARLTSPSHLREVEQLLLYILLCPIHLEAFEMPVVW